MFSEEKRGFKSQVTKNFIGLMVKKLHNCHYKIRLYAGNSEYPTVPYGKNLLVQTISREPIRDPSETICRTLNSLSEDIVRTLWRHKEIIRNGNPPSIKWKVI